MQNNLVKWPFKVSATEKGVIFFINEILHAQINLFESFLSNKKLEENNGSVESIRGKRFFLVNYGY